MIYPLTTQPTIHLRYTLRVARLFTLLEESIPELLVSFNFD